MALSLRALATSTSCPSSPSRWLAQREWAPTLHGYSTGREGGELPMEGSPGRGQASFFDQFTLLVEDCEIGVLVSQVQPDKSRAIV